MLTAIHAVKRTISWDSKFLKAIKANDENTFYVCDACKWYSWVPDVLKSWKIFGVIKKTLNKRSYIKKLLT